MEKKLGLTLEFYIPVFFYVDKQLKLANTFMSL